MCWFEKVEEDQAGGYVRFTQSSSDAVTAKTGFCAPDVRVPFVTSACGHGKVEKVNTCLEALLLAGQLVCEILPCPCNLFSRCLCESNTSDEKVGFASARSSAILATLIEGISKLSGP